MSAVLPLPQFSQDILMAFIKLEFTSYILVRSGSLGLSPIQHMCNLTLPRQPFDLAFNSYDKIIQQMSHKYFTIYYYEAIAVTLWNPFCHLLNWSIKW